MPMAIDARSIKLERLWPKRRNKTVHVVMKGGTVPWCIGCLPLKVTTSQTTPSCLGKSDFAEVEQGMEGQSLG